MTTEELKVKITFDTSEIAKAKKEISGLAGGSKENSKATKDTASAMEDLQGTMEAIVNLQLARVLSKGFKDVSTQTANVTKQMKAMKTHIKDAVGEFKLGFDKKHWADLGYTDSNWKNIKTMTGEALGSVREGFRHAGEACKAFGSIVATVMANVLKAISATAVGMALLGWNALKVSELAKQTNVLAQQAGMANSTYQKWSFILEQVGLQVDDMIGAQQTLLEAQVDVREGTEDIIKAFEQIGLSQSEVLGMNQQQLFEKTVEGLQNVENQTERATLAFKLLSEDSKNLAPLLNLTSGEVAVLANNFNQLNAGMSDGLIKSSNRLQASIGNLKASWQGLRNTLAELVLPVVIEVVNWLTKAIYIVNLFIRTIFGLDMGGASTKGVDNATSSVGGYTEAVETAKEQTEKLKRTLMGFDELNVVTNPNSGSSGAGADADGGFSSGGFAGGFTDGLFSADALDFSKYREWFQKYQTLIQDVTTWGLIGVGVGVAVIGALTGNLIMVSAGLGLAGIGFAVGNADGGTFDRLKEKWSGTAMEIVPVAMTVIGVVGAVICLFTGNIAGAIACAGLAGIGLSLGGGESIGNFVTKYEQEIKNVAKISIPVIGAVGATLCLLTGNIVGAMAFGAMTGIAMASINSGESIGQFVSNFKSHIPEIVNWATIAIGSAGAVVCLLSGNIPGAIAMGALAGISIYNVATGGSFFEDATNVIKNAWNGLRNWFNTSVKPVFTKAFWSEKFNTIKDSASEKLDAVKTTIGEKWEGVKTWWSGGPGKIFTKQYWLDKFDTIRDGINTKLGEARTAIINGWNNVKSYWSTNIAPKFTKEYWLNKFDTIRASIQEKLGAVRTQVINSWNAIKSYWTTYIAPKFTKQYWLTKFDTMRASMSEKLAEVRTTVINSWNSVKTYFNANIAPKFTVTYWKNKFNTIKDGAKSAFNGVISVVESAVNGIIKKINTLSWKIPDWVPKFGGEKFGFNFKTISIPRLATGGIAVSSTLANIGENGREAVLPLDNNTGWMDLLADRIASRSQGPTKLVLKVGERELGWATINGINQITKQTGELQLVL